nr:MAG TPA: 8-oxoguanine DNA glycosylase [Caudoviricetes sp.]
MESGQVFLWRSEILILVLIGNLIEQYRTILIE